MCKQADGLLQNQPVKTVGTVRTVYLVAALTRVCAYLRLLYNQARRGKAGKGETAEGHYAVGHDSGEPSARKGC